jgi:DNA-binding LacI/PurR family transcriptional regulator
MPTIKDVAQEAGVSIATVSYVLNNKTEMVSAETQRHVLATAKRLGYRPNITARNLQSSRTGLIGYAWHRMPSDEPHWLMDQFIYYLAQAVEALGYHLLTFTHPQNDPTSMYDDLMRSGRLDGFVLTETNNHDQRIRFLVDRGFPFVSFGRSGDELDFDWVDTDGVAGMRAAVEHLVELGHRRIAFFGWPENSLAGDFRLEGYLQGLNAAGLTVPQNGLVRSAYHDDIIGRTLACWGEMTHDQRPTAAIGISDEIAINVMRAGVTFGYEIGHTLSVVGFDDTSILKYVQPGLTTLRQPIPQITQALVAMLDANLQGRDWQPPQRLFAPDLIKRESSGPPPDRSERR